MHKYITRTLFATAMLALTVNNGIDVWRKLQSEPTPVASVEPVAVPAPELARQAAVNVAAQPIRQLGQPIPVVAPGKDRAVPSDKANVLAEYALVNNRGGCCDPNDIKCKLRKKGLMPEWRPGMDYQKIYDNYKAQGMIR